MCRQNIGETVIEGNFAGPESGYLISEDIYEPDNQYSSATSIVVDSPGQIHSLDVWSDVDWLIFNATEPMGVDIIADMFGREYTGLTIELYGPDSYSSYIAGTESWYFPGTSLTISRKGANALSPGTYYIKCHTKTNVYYAPGLYLLKIIGYPVNDVPIAIAPAALTEIPENGFALISLSGSDSETSIDKLTYEVYSPPMHGTVSINGNQAIYIPSSNYYGADSFEFTVTDTGNGSSPALTSAPATVHINLVIVEFYTDYDVDGVTNLWDLNLFGYYWGVQECSEPDWCDGRDLNMDGVVDIGDLGIFCRYWLAETPVDFNLIAHWRLDDNANNTLVSEGSNNIYAGTASANTDTFSDTSGMQGRSLKFNGSSTYIDTGEPFQEILRDSFSVSMWIKPEDGRPSPSQSIIGYRDRAGPNSLIKLTLTQSTGLLIFQYNSEEQNSLIASSPSGLSDGQEAWHHVVFVVTKNGTGATAQVYLDGIAGTLVSESGVGMSAYGSLDNMAIGAWNDDGVIGQYFAGNIDDVKIFNKDLTANEVQMIYNE